jgi:hypothetical protein
VTQDDARTFNGKEKPHRLNVGQRQLVEIQHGWGTTAVNFRTDVLDVFRLHSSDETNRCSVRVDIGDDPQSHERARPNAAPSRAIVGPDARCIALNDLEAVVVLIFQNLLTRRHVACGRATRTQSIH